MAGEVTKIIDQTTLWEGGRSPFSVSYGKMMMWFFLISDALTFGSLLASIGYMKHKYIEVWPISEQIFTHFPFTHAHLPLMYVAFMTFILIISSVTMVLAVEAGHRMDRKGVTFWLFLTVIGGAIFVGSQA
jgi:cytochrome c oxidase subunit 3